MAMANEKSTFLNWVGFKEGETTTQNSVDRIRELEAQLADLRSRRDITSLSKEEFEILATETAMSMIKSAQAREQKASLPLSALSAKQVKLLAKHLKVQKIKLAHFYLAQNLVVANTSQLQRVKQKTFFLKPLQTLKLSLKRSDAKSLP